MDLNKIVKKIRNSDLSESDVLKYGRILITEFAKEYHKKQLTLTDVGCTCCDKTMKHNDLLKDEFKDDYCNWCDRKIV